MANIIKKYVILSKLDQNFVKNIKTIICCKRNDVMIVTNDDKVYAYGDNKFGYSGLGHTNPIPEPTIVEKLCDKGIVGLYAGHYHYVARTCRQQIYCWGYNNCGQIGMGIVDQKIWKPESNDFLKGKNFVDISCGDSHSLALTESGDVYAWGDNSCRQIGSANNNKFISIPIKLNEFDGEIVTAISCGSTHSIALTESGKFYYWGRLSSGDKSPKFLRISSINGTDIKIKKIVSGSDHCLLLSEKGSVYTFGMNYFGQLGNGTRINENYPIKVGNSFIFTDIAAYYCSNTSVALSLDGIYYVWGKCGGKVFDIPSETRYKSFHEIFANYHQITYRQIDFGSKLKLNNFEINTNWEKHKNFLTLENILIEKYNQEFREIRLISSGNFSVVSEAESLTDNQIYAIKKIPMRREDIRSSIINTELIILSKLKSDYVVEYKSAWIENNYIKAKGYDYYKNTNLSLSHVVFDPYKPLLLHIQMEFCSRTLRGILNQIFNELNYKEFETLTPIGYYVASELSIELLECVNFLHKQNPPIIHRDLKPENILITKGINGRFVKLADFGLATIHEFGRQSHTQGSGTLGYIAPEVLKSRKYETKADIFSLGSIIQEIFNIDINKSYGVENNLISAKYENLIDLCFKMKRERYRERPNCDEILDNRSLWALNINEIKLVDIISDIDSISKPFVYNFIKSKSIYNQC